MVQLIRDCGESLIKNAESIVGSEKYRNAEIDIHIHIDGFNNCAPNIKIERSFMPEKCVERYK